ncbi:hypothetical protein DVH05_002922 [Phytophthora capsici]|nr:hypothetical protein DVH05_002922 [Phytophthora capsici]
MHRAEKSSSKICRAREVEKAQELHRKKINGVRSYLCGTAPKYSTSRSSSVNLIPSRSMIGNFSSTSCVSEVPSSMNLEHQNPTKTGSEKSEILNLENIPNQINEFQKSLAKMEEFREVAPIPGLDTGDPTKHQIKNAPPVGARRKTMNGSFRARRLREIKTDNAEVFERIRKSASHYRNDDLKREWQKNVSYLSSIREIPESNAPTKQQSNTVSRNCFGPSPRRSTFLKPTKTPEPLPIIPVVVHPIKSIPTSPKKLQLNMSTAFRSLRKAMPQQPSLPPIATPHCTLSTEFSLTSSNRSTCPSSPRLDPHFAESTTSFRSSTAAESTKFIGDLHGKQDKNENSKYQLLKTGRFVGGTYLVLTVFCGDGALNPYGFDVFAFHRELQCEYQLSITKEMTHELLDKISTSSLAAETAAAAGTNLSMQEIARHICDHISFALLGADHGEMVFLAPRIESKNDQAIRFDASPGLVAFCLHQTVENESKSPRDLNSGHTKRKTHVFASTCPPPVKMNGNMDTTGLKICFQVMDKLPPTSNEAILRVEASVEDLYSILNGSCLSEKRVISMERVVVAAIRHLHIISVPTGDEMGTISNELILNSHVNTRFQPVGRKHSQQELPHSSSQLFSPQTRATILIQSGLIWRNVYLLAEIALDNVEKDFTELNPGQRRQRLIQGNKCSTDVVVSVFNSNSGRSTCRTLSPEKIDALLEKLDTKTEFADIPHTFSRYLLQYLQLDVDLFGQEVIVFPSLENTRLPGDKIVDSPKKSEISIPAVVHAGDFLRNGDWEENISEGDEEAADDVEALDATLSIGILHYNSDEEGKREKSDASYRICTNQDEAGKDERPDGHMSKADETPGREDDSLELRQYPGRQWKRGCKVDGRFCFLQGISDDTTSSYWIAGSGQLEHTPASTLR